MARGTVNPRAGHDAAWWQNRIDYYNRRNCRTGKELQETLDALLEAHVMLAREKIVSVIVREFGNLVKQTPADTGRARAAWFMDTSPTEWTPPEIKREARRNKKGELILDKKGKPTYGKNILPDFAQIIRENSPDAAARKSLSQADVIYIINRVEYILALEAGWSVQAPRGFIANFMQRLNRELNNLAAKL